MSGRQGGVRGRLTALLASLAVVLTGAAVALPAAQAATGLEGFDPGNIISDESFFDASTMTVEQVAAFIAEKGAACVPGPDGTPCLKDHTSDIPDRPESAYCTAVVAKPGATAAETVTTAAQACGVNPQVLLVMLQKEQALVTATGDRLYADRYAKAMGLGCPDFQQCDPTRATFFGQVYGAAERFRIYQARPGDYKHRVGVVNKVAYHPEPLCGTAEFTIRNQATAGLYNYTPFVPNAASLAAVGGEGDLCSAYGNRNFYRYLKTWFPGSVSDSDAPPVQAQPRSTVTPQMTAIYRRAAEVGSALLGAATSPITCSGGTCTKQYAKATITWTAEGTRVTGKLPRVAGETRFHTAVSASKQGFPNGAATAFLATSTSYADALAAGPWAQREGAPVLLTNPDELPAVVADELRRLAPTRVVVVGGPRSVSDRVLATVSSVLPRADVDRVSGDSRYDTALAVSRAAFPTADEVLVATGRHFADALVGGPLAAGRAPILLVPGDAAPSAEVLAEVERLEASKVVLLGGEMWLGRSTQSGFARVAPTERVAGESRYDTAALVARRMAGPAARVYLASGELYQDALVSISLQSGAPGPLLLSRPGCVPAPTASWLRQNPDAPVTLIGGPNTLSGEVSALIPCAG